MNVTSLLSSRLALAACMCSSLVVTATADQYTLQVGNGAPFAISSIDYGTASPVDEGSGATAQTTLSPVTITVSNGTPELYNLLVGAFSGNFLPNVQAIDSNAAGKEQFAVQMTNATVTSFTFPGLQATPGSIGDITVVLYVKGETIYTPPTLVKVGETKTGARPAGLTQVWHTQANKGSLPSGPFALSIPNVNTAGVLSISALTWNYPFKPGLPRGKMVNPSMTLAIDSSKVADFATWYSKSGSFIPQGTLTFYRPGPTGAQTSVTFTVQNLVIDSFNQSGQSGSTPTTTVVVACGPDTMSVSG